MIDTDVKRRNIRASPRTRTKTILYVYKGHEGQNERNESG